MCYAHVHYNKHLISSGSHLNSVTKFDGSNVTETELVLTTKALKKGCTIYLFSPLLNFFWSFKFYGYEILINMVSSLNAKLVVILLLEITWCLSILNTQTPINPLN